MKSEEKRQTAKSALSSRKSSDFSEKQCVFKELGSKLKYLQI